jgi:hypothetical protein
MEKTFMCRECKGLRKKVLEDVSKESVEELDTFVRANAPAKIGLESMDAMYDNSPYRFFWRIFKGCVNFWWGIKLAEGEVELVKQCAINNFNYACTPPLGEGCPLKKDIPDKIDERDLNAGVGK